MLRRTYSAESWGNRILRESNGGIMIIGMKIFDDYCDDGVIPAAALQEILKKGADSIRILDASFVLPNSGQNARENFEAEHIRDAQFFDVNGICDIESELPHMLPPPEEFATAAGALGVAPNDSVVVYGQAGIVMGPARAWWMFRVFGHYRVCVLDGGLSAWKAAGGETVSGDTASVQPQNFEGTFRPELVKDIDQVAQASQNGTACIIDARPAPRFNGEVPEPRAGMNAGHIPSSINVPASNLVDAQTQMLKTRDELQALFSQTNLDSVITTCGSGVTACVIALALFRCGVKNAPVFDGSWAQWGNPAYNMHFNAR
jgi:thiosulfate/3-mercaptopyruvate sulfurtransferase